MSNIKLRKQLRSQGAGQCEKVTGGACWGQASVSQGRSSPTVRQWRPARLWQLACEDRYSNSSCFSARASLYCDCAAYTVKGAVRVSPPWIWGGLVTCFGQRSVAGVTFCEFQYVGFKRFCSSYSHSLGPLPACYQLRKSGLAYWKKKATWKRRETSRQQPKPSTSRVNEVLRPSPV